MTETLSVAVSMRVRRLRLARRLLIPVRYVPGLRTRVWLANGVLWMVRPEYRVDGGEWTPLTGRRVRAELIVDKGAAATTEHTGKSSVSTTGSPQGS